MPRGSRDAISPVTDHARLTELGSRRFDVLVIGGGITGSGIVREAAMRGLSAALVEKDDFASGTSSRSSRLVHGGVRYLEHGHLRLVFESSAERRRLLHLAPHLVRPLRFTWPVYRGARIPRWKLLAGLTLYDVLALFRNVARHHRLGADDVLQLQPRIRSEGLVGGATYFDASTDDSALTLALALDARDRGAVIVNHARVTRLISDGGKATGAEVVDECRGHRTTVSASVIVNATGPWSDSLRALEGYSARPRIQGSKGVHIMVDHDRVGNHDALTLLSPDDGRVMFVLPAGERTIIGTTDTFTSVSPDSIRATESDIRYLLDAANWFFPHAELTRADVISAWAGIRPLAAASAAGDSVSASREHSIAVSPSGMVSITGGKLTTFRIMAEQTVEKVVGLLRRQAPPSGSDVTPIAWDREASLEDVLAAARSLTGDAPLAAHLVGRYGNKWNDVLGSIRDEIGGAEPISPEAIYRMGELRYSCRREMALTLSDLLIRRSRIAFELDDHGLSIAARVAEYVAPILGWSAPDVAKEIERYNAEVTRIFGIDPDGQRSSGSSAS